MLVNDVINTKAIAYTATQNASNSVPFLGTQFFPAIKKAGLDLKWIKTHKGLGVSLAPSNFDALPTLRARGGLDVVKTQMAFFREQMVITEEDEQEIARVQDANDPYLASALANIYDDANNLVEGAEIVAERMRMQLLSSAQINITDAEKNVAYTYNYDPDGSYAKSNTKTLTTKWTDTTNAKPLTDLNNAKKALAKQGKKATYVLMNSNTFQYLVDNAQVSKAILAQNATANIFISDDVVKQAIKLATGLTVLVYDKMFNGENGDENFYPDGKVTLLPEGTLGKTVYGTTPEERTATQVADVDVTMYGVGIALAKKVEYGPPAITSITASEIVLPSFENMDATYIITVA